MSENGEIYTAGKNFTLPPAVTALTNLTSATDMFFSFILETKTTTVGLFQGWGVSLGHFL